MNSWRLALIAIFAAAPLPAAAQDPAPEVDVAKAQGIKVVVPDATGKAAYGTKALTAALRKRMVDGVGPLVPVKALTAAQKKLKLKTKDPVSLAKAGAEAGAQYVLTVEITKSGWLYTAQAMLINTQTAEAQMDFRSQFYKPGQEAGDRGERIGKRTVEKIALLVQQGLAPSLMVAMNDPSNEPNQKLDEPTNQKLDEPTNQKLDEPTNQKLDEPTNQKLDEPTNQKLDEPTNQKLDEPTNQKMDDPPPSAPPPSAPPPSAPPPAYVASTSVEAPPPEESPRGDDTELVRFAVAGGAGLLRNYSLSSDQVDSSRLSYNLSPLGLIHADAEVIVPGVPVFVATRFDFRPVRYDIGTEDLGRSTPSGTLMDIGGVAGYQVVLAGEGRTAFRLLPGIGARFGSASVGRHAGDIVLSATTLAVLGSVGVRLPFNEVLEVNIGVDGGLILSYSESPAVTGSSGGGFSIGGDVGARIWLSKSIGVAIDNRFTLDNITLDGTPTRQLPLDESGRLTSAAISMRDLRSSIGIAFRF